MRRRSKLFVSFILLSAMLCMTNTYRFAYRTFISFPFDPELGIVEKRTIPNGDNSPVEEVVIIAPNSTSQECIDDWKGDGNCDESNNNVACDYDGGDCCRKTCEDNCSTNSCGFECGTVNLYNCINPSAGCHICVHGTCQDPTSCLQSDAVVNLAIDVCTLIPWSMGNGSTVDAFCGKDPNKLIVHDTDDPTKHFDGCGFTQEKCTLEPCCSDIETAIATGFPKTTEEIRTCFTNNMRSRGQCCECEEGWTGYGCDVPVCDPPCVQGECIDKDTCQCYDGWQGAICDDAICTDCQNGNCIAPEVCDCYYGYIEENCSRMIHTIECEHGTVTAVDKCTCDAGWTGEICDKPVCSTPCVDGWCKAPDYCEKRAKYERNDPDKVKCEYYDPNCLTCDNTQCLTCLNGHYYSTVDKMCRSCSINYDSFCITCDSTKCTECAWPRQLREVSSQQKCVTSGVIEFANPNLIFFEDSEEILIYLRCLEGCTSYDLNLDGTAPLITVDYRYHVQSLSIIEKKASTDCTFASGSTECEIRVKVFIDPFIKPDDYIIGFSLENPRGGALIGSQDYLSVYLYDIPLVSPIDSYATLNGEFNEESYKRIKIGDNNVFLIYSYLEEGQKKANEDDLFFLSVVDESWNATTNIKEFKIVDFISSAYVSDEVNKIEYTLKFSSVNYFLIYSSIPETITANFYENYELISPVYINRQLKSFPNEFTDDTEFDYSSASFTTAFVVPVTGKYKFYITVSKNSKVDFKVNSQRLLTIDNTLFATVKTGKDSTSTTTKITCGSTYLTSSCCLDTEYSEEIEDSYTAGTPLLLEFNFYHKTGKPCILVYYENLNDGTGAKHLLEGDVLHGPLLMEESSFQIRPYLDSSLVDFASSELIFLDHVDPNTGQTISDMQAGMVNTIQIRIKDIYGNEFTEGHDVSFMLKLTPESGAALSYISAFNSITLKYEFYAIPVKAGTTLVEVLETLSGQHLSGSPVNKTVIAGKYEPSKFLISAPSGSCYIAIDCILTLEMYDANSNKILSSGFLDTDFDIESLAIGPIGVPENQSTSRISTIVENAGTGTFSLTLIITKSGDYEIYTRVKSLQILSYPYQLEAVSNQASAPNSIITQSPVSPSMAGVTIIYNLEVYDEFDNLAVDEIIPSEAIMYLNENVTLTGIVTKTSTAQYTIQFDPTISGDYSLRIKIFDKSETYRFIKDMPQTQTIYPSYISASLSTYNGSGLNSGRFGFLEQFDLNIKDIYDNLYHEEYIFYGGTNQSVYKIEYLADDTDSKDVILISKTPTQGLYTLGYRIVNAYAQLYIRIWLYVSTDSGATYSYTQVNDFPIIVPIVFSPSDLLDEYTNLYQGGIGITEKSTSSILNNVTAGSGVTKFMEVSPKNAYSLSYVHDEVRDYLVVDYQTQGDGSELCLCQDLSDMSPSKLPQAYHNESSLAYTLKNCHKLSFSKNQCNLAGICLWDAASAQSQNFHSNDCKPRTCSDCSKIDVTKYEKQRDPLQVVKNGVIYDVSGSFTRSGKYDLRVSAITMGMVKVTAYKTIDFNHQMFEEYINWIDFGLNSTFNFNLASKRNYYSVTVKAFLSCLVSDNYEIILDTKYRGFLYLNGVKYLSGSQTKFRKDLVNDKFYDLEIRIVVDQRVPDVDDENNLVRLRWSTQNIAERDIKPRNFYYFTPLEDNGSHVLTVLADTAKAANSTVVDTTSNIQGIDHDTERRLDYKIINSGQSISGYLLAHDHYGNLRGPQGEATDTVIAILSKNWVVSQTVTLTQEPSTYRYEYTFTPTVADRYQVEITINGDTMGVQKFTVR